MAECIEAAICCPDPLLTTLPNLNFYHKVVRSLTLYCSRIRKNVTDRETEKPITEATLIPNGSLGWAGQFWLYLTENGMLVLHSLNKELWVYGWYKFVILPIFDNGRYSAKFRKFPNLSISYVWLPKCVSVIGKTVIWVVKYKWILLPGIMQSSPDNTMPWLGFLSGIQGMS